MRRHCVNGFDFRNLSKRNVVRATAAALVELNSDWLNCFTRTRVSDDSLNCFFLLKLIKWTVIFFFGNEFYRCRGNTLTMCEFHESTYNGFGDIWWTDNPIYFSSIDRP